MEEIVYFESTIKADQINVQISVTSNIGNNWVIEENWYTQHSDLIQNIVLKKEGNFRSNYYGDLEIRPISFDSMTDEDKKTYLSYRKILPIPNPYGCMIQKCTRGTSSRLEFKIYLEEYDCFQDFTYTFPISRKYYGIKIVVSPILPLVEVPKFTNRKRMKRKRTKRHLLAGLMKLSTDIQSLLDADDTAADVILKCGKKTVLSHRNLLAVRSLWFSKKFCKFNEFDNSTDCKDGGDFCKCELFESNLNKSYTVLDESDAPVFDDILNFIYSGIYIPRDAQQTMKIYVAACKYGVHDLERKCIMSLKSLIDLENVIDILNFACYYKNLVDLKFYVLDLIFIKKTINIVNLDHFKDWDYILRKYQFLKTDIKTNYLSSDLFHDFCHILCGEISNDSAESSTNTSDAAPSDGSNIVPPDTSNNVPLNAASEA